MILLALLLAAQPPAPPEAPDVVVQGQRAPVIPLAGGTDFISPMGEPFHSPDKLSGAEHWFRQADANHDNKLTKLEMRADADRFFKILDTNHDGEIDPNEISHYEQVIAPEIMVLSTWGDMSKATQDSDGNMKEPPYPDRIGAGRYGYLAMPEPVTYADANMDRAVSQAEFEQASDRRFRMLDHNADGLITRDELPKLANVHDRD